MATPSLAMIPSAYADSKVYSVLPTNGDGDFTFNRDSSATRVGQNGLIQEVGYFGNELITNGSFDTDSDWTKGTSWTIGGGVATSDGGQSSLTQSIAVVLGRNYLISFNVNRNSGTLFVRNSSDVTIRTIDANNNDSFQSFTYTATSTGLIKFYSYDYNGTIDNVSVKEVTGDQPRLNYDISNGVVQSCPSLLLEPASTNVYSYSQDFSNSYWTKSGTSVISGFVSPDGTLNAFKLIGDGANSTHLLRKYIAATASTDYSFSFFVKKDEINKLGIREDAQTGAYASFNLETKAIITEVSMTLTYEEVGDYLRLKVVSQIGSNGTAGYTIYMLDDAYSGGVVNGSRVIPNGSGFYIFGAQLEALSYATSYIPTNGASQTRAAETCSKSGLTNYIGQTEGTVFAEINVSSIESVGGFSGFRIYDGTTSNSISFIIYPTGRIQSTTFNGGSLVVNLNFNNYGLTSGVHKIAVAYKENDYILYVDGSLVGSDVSATVPTVNQFDLSYTNGGSLKYNQTRIFKTRLTDAQLQTLTTL